LGTAVAIVVAVALAELLLSGIWAPFYFRAGIPVFSRTLPYRGGRNRAVDADVLSKTFASSVVSSIVFRAIGPEEIAFRERLLQLTFIGYAPVMRGLIRFDEYSQQVTVRGHANACPLCFLATAVGFCLRGPSGGGFEVFPLVPTVVLLFGVVYAFQAVRFNGVCKEVEKQLRAR